MIRKPIRKTSLFKFMTVLRTEVWLSIVAALVLTGFMIWLLDKYSPYSARNNPDAYPYPCRQVVIFVVGCDFIDLFVRWICDLLLVLYLG